MTTQLQTPRSSGATSAVLPTPSFVAPQRRRTKRLRSAVDPNKAAATKAIPRATNFHGCLIMKLSLSSLCEHF